MASGDFIGFGEESEVNIVSEGDIFGGEHFPEQGAVFFVWFRELDPEADTSCESIIDASFEVGGKYYDTVKAFDALEEVVDFEVGVPIDAGFDLGSFGEERVCLVKEQHDLSVFSGGEEGREMFFRFSDELRDQL